MAEKKEYQGALYQLYSEHRHAPGDYFFINGPHDIHGRVIKCTERLPEQVTNKTEQYLNLIRGTGKDKRKQSCQLQ